MSRYDLRFFCPDSTAMVRATVGIFVCEGRMPPPHDGVICVCPHV